MPFAKTELVHDVCTVRMYSAGADDQSLGDILVGVAVGNELQDFALALGQPLIFRIFSFLTFEVAFDQPAGHAWVEEGVAVCNRFYCVDQLVCFGTF